MWPLRLQPSRAVYPAERVDSSSVSHFKKTVAGSPPGIPHPVSWATSGITCFLLTQPRSREKGVNFTGRTILVFTLDHTGMGRKGCQNKTDDQHTEEGRVSVRLPEISLEMKLCMLVI